jgi:small GTP-binding protein
LSRSYNILVTGTYGAGKTRFIQTISDLPIVSTEKNISHPTHIKDKKTTTVAMDYGRVQIGKDQLHLRGTPGQARFSFMREILSKKLHGFVLLIDSTRPETFEESARILEDLRTHNEIAHIIAANKQDLPNAIRYDLIRQQLSMKGELFIVPCTSTHKASVVQVLTQLLEQFP